ncbi:MAG: VWA domain-containing protein [Thermodesulfobacteriota bacterium]
MNLSHPWVLYFLWLLPPMAFAFIVYRRERRKDMERFADPELLKRLTGPNPDANPFLKALLCLTAFGLMILALAGPRWGSHYQEVHQKGVDIMVLLDVSPSMVVEDVKPNRLERAKREIRDFLNNIRGDRVGLVVFSGAAFTQCPLTLDYGAVRMFLNTVEPGLVPVPGTDLGAAIQTGISAFNTDVETDKVMLLITDGEDNEKRGIQAARKAAEKGIKIFVFGMGDPDGGPIPLSGNQGGFKKDPDGNLILSKLNEEGLREMATITGGDYVRSMAGDLDLDLLYFDGIKSKTSARSLKSGKIKVHEERFSLFIIAAFALLLFEAMLGRMRGATRLGREPASLHQQTPNTLLLPGILAASVLFLLLCIHSPGLAAPDPDTLYKEGRYEEAEKRYAKKDMDHPRDIRYRYNRGCASYKHEQFKGAMAAFTSVLKRTQDRETRFKAAFNAGNAAFKQGNFQSAKSYYAQAIRLNPENQKAKHNFELALRKLAQKETSGKEQKRPPRDQGQDRNKSQNKNRKENTEKPKEPSTDQGGEKDQQEKKPDARPETKADANPQQQQPDPTEPGEQQQPENLSGDLKPSGTLPEPAEAADRGSQAATMAEKKAEALLDNVNENRAKFLKFRIPPSKQDGVSSGKDW